MSATKYDFNIEQGSSFSLSLINKDNDGNVINMTNYCARLTMTTNKAQTFVFETGNPDLSQYQFAIEGNLGKITLNIPASTTNAYTFDSAKYDFELQAPNDHYAGGGKYTERILYGVITLNKRFSKSPSLLDCNT